MATTEGLKKLEDMVESFSTLLRAARIVDDTMDSGAAQGGEMVEVLAEKLVASGQDLLGVIGQLKRNALLSDFPAQNRSIKHRREVLNKEVDDCTAELAALNVDVAETLQDLEALYYSCPLPRSNLPGPDGPTDELKELQLLVKNVQLTLSV